IHETGHQMMQTGYLFRGGREHPHYGAALSHLKGPRPGGLPPFAVLPGPIGNTGARHEPFFLRADGGLDPARMKSRKELVAAVDSAHRAFDADSKARDAA